MLGPPGYVLCLSPCWDPPSTNITSASGRCPGAFLPQLTQQRQWCPEGPFEEWGCFDFVVTAQEC